MERRNVIAGLAVTFAMLGTTRPALTHGYRRGSIAIEHPWCSDRFEPESRDVIVGMIIKCRAPRGDRVLGAEGRVATSMRLHDQSGATQTALSIPGNGALTLGRTGYCLRLIGLRKPLIPYDTLPVTLVFERAGRISIDILVEESHDSEG